MDSTPRRSPSTAGSQMHLILRSASLHPPPTTSLDAAVAASGGSGRGNAASVVTCELMAVSEGLDLAMLCAGNEIRAVSLLDVPDAAARAPGSITPTPARGGQQQHQVQQEGDDPFSTVSFSVDSAPRPGDDTIPSSAIPPKTPIKRLEFSPSGHSLLIWGESYVAVARLPRNSRTNAGGGGNPTPSKHETPAAARGRAGGEGDSNGETRSRWRWTLVDMSGYAVDVMKQRIVQAAWHPASDSCVTLLTVEKDEVFVTVAEGRAKAFLMLQVPGRERPEQVLPIPDGPSPSPPAALAHSHCAGWQRFAVWIARRDGSVGALCPVVPRNAKVDIEELLELWSATSDTLAAARWEQQQQSAKASKGALAVEVQRLEQQQAWLRETFSHVFDEDLEHGPAAMAGALATRTRRHLVLQDRILVGRAGDEADAACGLVVLAGAGGGGGGGGGDEAAAAAPPPVVLAVAYRTGCVDIAVVPAGIGPRWSVSAGTRVSCAAAEVAGEPVGAVLESLNLAERADDKTVRRRQGLSLRAGAGAWTLLAATPCRLTSVVVTWAGRIEKAAMRARERAAQGRSSMGCSADRLDGDLRALLRARPDSAVTEVLVVAPDSTGRIVGVVPVASPIVGHLALARLGGGQLEMMNLAVMALQATEVASAAKRAQAQETPGRGDMLPRFEAALEKTIKALDERRIGESLGTPVDHLLMSQLDQEGVRAVEDQAHRLVDGGVVVLEKLHLKTSTRLETLGDVYEHQTGMVKKLSKDIARLRNVQEDIAETLEEMNDVADEHRTRSAGVLAVVQATRPDISPAERAFMSEMKDMENYADRQQVMMEPATKQVEELCMAEREAEDYLVRQAEGGGSGAGTGLSERETRDVWNMLQADRERILNVKRRMEAARARLDELGVREE